MPTPEKHRRDDAPYEFGARKPDGTWALWDPEVNLWLNRALDAFDSHPDSILVRDDHGGAHWLSHEAREVLRLALLALDAQLRQERGYQGNAGGIRELRAVFRLGVPRTGRSPLQEN